MIFCSSYWKNCEING